MTSLKKVALTLCKSLTQSLEAVRTISNESGHKTFACGMSDVSIEHFLGRGKAKKKKVLSTGDVTAPCWYNCSEGRGPGEA